MEAAVVDCCAVSGLNARFDSGAPEKDRIALDPGRALARRLPAVLVDPGPDRLPASGVSVGGMGLNVASPPVRITDVVVSWCGGLARDVARLCARAIAPDGAAAAHLPLIDGTQR